MKNLLIINHTMDAGSQVLSHQSNVAVAIAPYFKSVIVITGHYDGSLLPSNVLVYSTSWNQKQRLRSIFAFYKTLIFVMKRHKISVVFSHMASYKALLVTPVATIMRWKQFVWYAHASYSFHLRLLSLFRVRFISSTVESFPKRNGLSVEFIGQGVDPLKFPFRQAYTPTLTRFVHIGRFDPSKKVDEILRALSVLRKDFEEITFTNFGNSSTEAYVRWSEELRKGLDDEEYGWITLNPGVLRSEVSFTLLKYDVFVHAFNGSLDKILIEAAMSGIPIITTNEGFIRMFGSWGVYNGKKVSIEEEYGALVEYPRVDIEERLVSIRNLAVKMHSEVVWVQKLVEAIQ